MAKPADSAAKALRTFRRHGGTLRTGAAMRAGIHPRTLYALRDTGRIEQLSRGLYRLADAAPSAHPDLLTVAARVPAGVICLTSALAFHRITTQIPHQVDIALPHGAWAPKFERPPVRVYRFSAATMRKGVETHDVGGVSVRMFCAEKSIADCFKFRHKIGLDIAIEALRMYLRRPRANVESVMGYATIDRVSKVMRPYLEAVL